MSDQTLVDRSLDRLIGVPREPSGLSDIAVGATPPASRFGALSLQQEFRSGALLYLVCAAFVAVATIGVFFGVGLHALGHSHRNVIADSGAKHAPAVLSGETPTGAEVPAVVAASLGTLVTMSSSAVPPPRTMEPGATGPQPGPTAPPDATSQALGGSAEQGGRPIEGWGEKHSESKRFAIASTEIVSGTVTQVTDAMTWVVGNKTVYLWGIRPAAPSLLPSLEKVADWVRAKGPVECRKQAHSSRYRCSTSAGDDVAEAALLAGVARAADRATQVYRNAEAQARRRGKGL